MMTFILELETPSLATKVIDSLVPVVVDTADLVFTPRFKFMTVPDHIDGTACMSLLYLVALGCMSAPEEIIRFWRKIPTVFLQCVLSPNQLRVDFEIMLKLLSTSVMKDSFASYQAYPFQTRHILDRLMHRFIAEVPISPITKEKFDASTIFKERWQILELLVAMTRSPYTGREIAIHPEMIGGYIRLLSDALDDLYDYKGNAKEL
jgi:hypothetical protein